MKQKLLVYFLFLLFIHKIQADIYNTNKKFICSMFDTIVVDTLEMTFDTTVVGQWKTVSFIALDENKNRIFDYKDTVKLTLNNSEATSNQVRWNNNTFGGIIDNNFHPISNINACFYEGKLNLLLCHEFADSGLSISITDQKNNIILTTPDFGFQPDIVDSLVIKIPNQKIYAQVNFDLEIIPVDKYKNINNNNLVYFELTAKNPEIMSTLFAQSGIWIKGKKVFLTYANESIEEQWILYYNGKYSIDGDIYLPINCSSGRTKKFIINPPDNDPPVISEIYPADKDTIFTNIVDIQFKVEDNNSGILYSSLIMKFMGDTLTPKIENNLFSFNISNLQNKEYTYTIEISDSLHNVAFDTISFFVRYDTSIEPSDSKTLESFYLNQNYPNPFNPSTTIEFYLPKSQNVEISIYSITGKKVKSLVNELIKMGHHTINWNATNDKGNKVHSGPYLYCIKCGDEIYAKKMLYIK